MILVAGHNVSSLQKCWSCRVSVGSTIVSRSLVLLLLYSSQALRWLVWSCLRFLLQMSDPTNELTHGAERPRMLSLRIKNLKITSTLYSSKSSESLQCRTKEMGSDSENDLQNRHIMLVMLFMYCRRPNEFVVFCCCFSHSAHWLPTRKKLLYTVANPARGLLNRILKKKSLAAPRPPLPPPPRRARRIHMSCLGATQVVATQVVSIRLASVQGFLRLVV